MEDEPQRSKFNYAMPIELRKQVERWAKERGVNTTAALNLLLRAALQADPPAERTRAMKTRTDAKAFVIVSLTDFAGEHHVEAIIDELYDTAGSWDFDSIPDDRYWAVVQKHAKKDA